MPLFRLYCNDCGRSQIFVCLRSKLEETTTNLVCSTSDCEGDGWLMEPPQLGCHVVERLDNGAMERAVERPRNINELVQDHKKAGE